MRRQAASEWLIGTQPVQQTTQVVEQKSEEQQATPQSVPTSTSTPTPAPQPESEAEAMEIDEAALHAPIVVSSQQLPSTNPQSQPQPIQQPIVVAAAISTQSDHPIEASSTPVAAAESASSLPPEVGIKLGDASSSNDGGLVNDVVPAVSHQDEKTALEPSEETVATANPSLDSVPDAQPTSAPPVIETLQPVAVAEAPLPQAAVIVEPPREASIVEVPLPNAQPTPVVEASVAPKVEVPLVAPIAIAPFVAPPPVAPTSLATLPSTPAPVPRVKSTGSPSSQPVPASTRSTRSTRSTPSLVGAPSKKRGLPSTLLSGAFSSFHPFYLSVLFVRT